MSRTASLFTTGFLALVAFGLLVTGSRCHAQKPLDDKLGLRILYVGHPESSRESDFVTFLKQHFRQVTTADLGKFDSRQVTDADVVLLDYDGDGFKAPRPSFPVSYARSTVTIGVAGGLWSSERGLKTGYM